MLVILNICDSLIQITIWTDAGSSEAVLNFAEKFLYHGNSILSNDYAFHFNWLYLDIPFVSSNIIYYEPLLWISIEHLPYQIFSSFRNNSWYQIVTVKDLFV